MLSRIILVGSFGILVVAQLLFAHGEDHIEGTVTKLDAKHMVVKSGFGMETETITILLSKSTRYYEGEAEASAGDLKVGDRVDVGTLLLGQDLKATDIRFTRAKKQKNH